jgi:hypothetical protein
MREAVTELIVGLAISLALFAVVIGVDPRAGVTEALRSGLLRITSAC